MLLTAFARDATNLYREAADAESYAQNCINEIESVPEPAFTRSR
jgi:hypothetical protein